MNKVRGLFHRDFFGQMSLKKDIVDIQLSNGPLRRVAKERMRRMTLGLITGAKCLMVVYGSIFLPTGETPEQPNLNRTIRTIVYLMNPLILGQILRRLGWNEMSSAISH